MKQSLIVEPDQIDQVVLLAEYLPKQFVERVLVNAYLKATPPPTGDSEKLRLSLATCSRLSPKIG